MRVVHLMKGSACVYGAERVLLAELAELRAQGVDARFVMLQEARLGEQSDVLGQAVEALGLPVARVPVESVFSRRVVADLRRVLEEERPAVVHSHGYKADVIGLLACRLAKLPIVGEVSGWLFPKEDYKVRFYEWLDVQALKRMDRVIVLADHYRRMTLRMGIGREQLRLIPSGVDPASLRARAGRAELRQRLGLPVGVPTVGMLTRLSPEKGVDIFLRAVALVAPAVPRMRAVIFGTGPEEETLRGLAAELGIEQWVVWAGYVDEAMDALLALDVVAQTSRTEALPQTLMEAMVMERPVVVTAVGGCPELVVDGRTGFVSPSMDPETIAARILCLLTRPELRRQMGVEGARRIDERYTLRKWAQDTIQLYEEFRH
ncbi:MAG: glycosyltransferase [Deltaproteobacteria bacterium]|nr:glycosyltransferase [Deltaproteobacteria bacterium]